MSFTKHLKIFIYETCLIKKFFNMIIKKLCKLLSSTQY